MPHDLYPREAGPYGEGELGPRCFSPPPTPFPLDINQDGEDPNFRVRSGLLFFFISLRSRISRFPFLDEQGCPLPPHWWGDASADTALFTSLVWFSPSTSTSGLPMLVLLHLLLWLLSMLGLLTLNCLKNKTLFL